jgi:hypothetical protein
LNGQILIKDALHWREIANEFGEWSPYSIPIKFPAVMEFSYLVSDVITFGEGVFNHQEILLIDNVNFHYPEDLT